MLEWLLLVLGDPQQLELAQAKEGTHQFMESKETGKNHDV